MSKARKTDTDDILDVLGALISRMDERFNAIEKTLDEKADKSDIDRIFGLFDNHQKRIETLEDEKHAIASQLDRHDRWAHEPANKAGHTPSL